MTETNEQTTIPPPQYSADTVYRHIRPESLVEEVVELRALVRRHRECLEHVRSYVTTSRSHRLINEALADHGNLPYEIY